ncbi:MAG: hypothetical protein ACXAB7_04450 [Candidatus Kariarchaeaceae archaeon]
MEEVIPINGDINLGGIYDRSIEPEKDVGLINFVASRTTVQALYILLAKTTRLVMGIFSFRGWYYGTIPSIDRFSYL